MSWAIGTEAARIAAFVPGMVAWARRAVADSAGLARIAEQQPRIARSTTAQLLETLRLEPEAEQQLLDAGMPPDGSLIYAGPKRAADTPKDAANKFVLWARVVEATGTYSARTICALYWECADVDHREPVADERFLNALKTTPGVRKEASASDRRRYLWTIEPAPPAPMAKPAQAADAAVVAEPPVAAPAVQPPAVERPAAAKPQPVAPQIPVAAEMPVAPQVPAAAELPVLAPLLPAAAQAAVAAQSAVAAKTATKAPPVIRRPQRFLPEQEYASPQLLHATAHEARRLGRARKQRGSRNVRWAA